jgi:hypothetical protein
VSDDATALEQLLRVSRPGVPHVVSRYLYFPCKSAAAKAAAAELRSQGFTTEERLGADGMNWLVLARHAVVPSDATIGTVRQVMENATRVGAGEYDGWEAEVQS